MKEGEYGKKRIRKKGEKNMKKHFKKLVAILMPVALTIAPMASMAEEASPAEYCAEEEGWDDQMIIPGEEPDAAPESGDWDMDYDYDTDAETVDYEEADWIDAEEIEDWDTFFEEDEFTEEEISDEELAEEELAEEETDFDDPEDPDALFDEEELTEARYMMMASMIDEAVEERQDEGIYAALNNTFEVLAENASELTDPDNGKLDVDGDDIVNVTFDVLSTHFDNSPEELMGAIGAATARADDKGLIAELGNDSTLKAMALEEKNEGSYWDQAKKYLKPGYEAALEAIAMANPEVKPFLPILKIIGGVVFGGGGGSDNMAQIQQSLDELSTQLTETKKGLEDHMYNVVAMSDIGDQFGTVRATAQTVRTRIQNHRDNDDLSEDEKIQLIADLCNSPAFMSLETAVNGGTECFFSDHNDIFYDRNIFDAAYATACETVMFSREALRISMPYLVDQLASYTAAYSVMSEVYDAYETVYGANSLKASRKDQAERLYGMDLDGNKICDSVADRVAQYFGRDKYIFVNRNNHTNIPLSSDIYVCDRNSMTEKSIQSTYYYSNWVKTPDHMSKNPLSQDQLKSLAAYCAEKNMTIFDFVLNDMKFKPDRLTAAERKAGGIAPPPFNITTSWDRGVIYVPTGSYVYGKVLLATGHSLNKHQSGERAWIDYEAVNATQVGAKEETFKLAEASLNYFGNICGYSYYQNCPMFFQSR